jgi:hypothetical protein
MDLQERMAALSGTIQLLREACDQAGSIVLIVNDQAQSPRDLDADSQQQLEHAARGLSVACERAQDRLSKLHT